MLVFLDSSVICTDFYMRGTYFDLLKKVDTIVLSEVVIAEVKNKHQEMINENLRNMNKSISTLDRLLSNPVQADTENLLIQEQEAYSDFIEMFLIESGMTIAEPYPEIEHEQIVERALQRKKPFKSDGKNGYRDYLVWRSFLDMAKRLSMEEVCFITLNKKDFSDEKDEKKFHPDLLVELNEAGISVDRVHYWISLKDYVEGIVKPQLSQNEEKQEFADSLLSNKEGFSQPLETLIFEQLVGLDLSDYDVTIWGENSTISTVDEIYCIEIEKASNVSDTECLLEIHLDIVCSIESYLLKSELAAIGEKGLGDSQVINSDWNDHYVLLGTDTSLKIEIDVIYNIEQKVFSTFELSDVSDYNCIYCPYD